MPRDSRNEHVATPAWLYDALDAEFGFDHDPCPSVRAPGEDGLVDEWGACNYVNPPFTNVGPWIARAVSEMDARGARSVCLVPVKTSTRYWHAHVFPRASEIRFLDRLVRFPGFDAPFPNPMAVLVFDPAVPAPPRAAVAIANGHGYARV